MSELLKKRATVVVAVSLSVGCPFTDLVLPKSDLAMWIFLDVACCPPSTCCRPCREFLLTTKLSFLWQRAGPPLRSGQLRQCYVCGGSQKIVNGDFKRRVFIEEEAAQEERKTLFSREGRSHG